MEWSIAHLDLRWCTDPVHEPQGSEMKTIKRVVAAITMGVFLSACGQPLVTKEKTYDTVGVVTLDKRSNKVCYGVSIGNTIWSIVLVETIVFPIYFVGWSILNPERMKKDAQDDCTVDYEPKKDTK
jgi:hypothetical protein